VLTPVTSQLLKCLISRSKLESHIQFNSFSPPPRFWLWTGGYYNSLFLPRWLQILIYLFLPLDGLVLFSSNAWGRGKQLSLTWSCCGLPITNTDSPLTPCVTSSGWAHMGVVKGILEWWKWVPELRTHSIKV
jgi:hypothetical protein